MKIKGLTKPQLNYIYDNLKDASPAHTMNCIENTFECGWKEAIDTFMLEIEQEMRNEDHLQDLNR